MAKIIVNNPKQVINGGAKKYYFKVKGLGGLKGDKGDKGDKGEKGDTGAQGLQGLSATVRIGTTTTGEPGTQASVRNSGTESNAVLDFTIPRGDTGSQPELVQTTGTSTTKAMSQNATTEALNNISETKQDKLTAGDNIKIENGVISSTDTTYTAGNGLNLNGTEFSADTTVLATKGNLEDYYTKPETDNLLAPKLETQMVAELPTRGGEGKLYLTPKAHTTQTATGNPITATVTEEVGVIERFQLDGDTHQQTYTGKNLFNKNSAKIVGGYINDSAVVSSYQDPITDQIDRLAIVPCLPNTTYTITKPTTSDLSKNRFRIGTSEDSPVNGSKLNDYWNAGDGTSTTTHTFTTSPTANWLCIFYGQTENNDPSDILQTVLNGVQLELGSTATSYEPYVGGTPSPNPDYPQPIQAVTGLQTVEVQGKNLFNNEPKTSSQFNVTTNSQVTRVVGDITSWWNLEWSGDKLNLVLGETYTARLFILDNPKNYAGTINLWFDIQDQQAAQSVPLKAASGYQKTFTYELTRPLRALRVAFDANNAGVDITFCIQIEKGSTATAFVPYSKQSYEINLGKNLFDKNAQIVNGYTYISDGSLATLQNCSIQEAYIPVKPSTTYTLHTDATSSQASNFRVYICEYDSGKGFIKRDAPKPISSSTNTITTTANTHFVRLCFSTVCIDTLQFEAGSTSTTYAPYFEPIELCKLGEYQDYIWKDGEDWKVHKDIGKYQFNGSENWIRSGLTRPDTFVAAIATKLQDYLKVKDTNTLKSAYFIQHKQVNTASGQMNAYNGTDTAPIAFALSFDSASITNITDAVTWISNNKPTVYSAINNPTDTVITDQTLIEQLEAISKASLGNGTNTITNTATDSNLAGDMGIGYYGYNPRNRYDKWLWLDIDNEYEQIGS